jgi:predicted nucleic acid-binding protein
VIVVADASPLRYLVVIGAVDVLKTLFTRVLVPLTGTLGVLADAHLAALLDFETALAGLRATNFYISEEVIEGLRQRLSRSTP